MQCFVLTLFINLVIIVLHIFFLQFFSGKAKSKETILCVCCCVAYACASEI